MTLILELSRAVAVLLTFTIGLFALRYGLKAPWWRSFEGRTIFLSFSFFFLTMLNLVIYLFTEWAWYRCGMLLTMLGSTIAVIYLHVGLTRARRQTKEETRQELLRRLNQ